MSVGQLAYNTYTNENGTIINGVQYAYEIYLIDGISEYQNLSCTIYPNPTTDFLQIDVENYENLSYIMYDVKGEFIESRQLL